MIRLIGRGGYVYKRTPRRLIQDAYLKASTPARATISNARGDNGDTIVVGAYGESATIPGGKQRDGRERGYFPFPPRERVLFRKNASATDTGRLPQTSNAVANGTSGGRGISGERSSRAPITIPADGHVFGRTARRLDTTRASRRRTPALAPVGAPSR